MRAQYRTFTEQFRRDAVRLAEKSPRSLVEIARDLGVGHSTLHRWYHQEMAKRPKKPPVATSARPSAKESPEARIARLELELANAQKKIDALETDREILKKAAAFFAKESE